MIILGIALLTDNTLTEEEIPTGPLAYESEPTGPLAGTEEEEYDTVPSIGLNNEESLIVSY